jgi:hypothetical protein
VIRNENGHLNLHILIVFYILSGQKNLSFSGRKKTLVWRKIKRNPAEFIQQAIKKYLTIVRVHRCVMVTIALDRPLRPPPPPPSTPGTATASSAATA